MARKPRKIKAKPVSKLWEMETATLEKLIEHVKQFKTSGVLKSYQAELGRRNDGISVEEFYKVEEEDESL